MKENNDMMELNITQILSVGENVQQLEVSYIDAECIKQWNHSEKLLGNFLES